jgi:dipeptidyl aminopeptidase/acylaminoacyl peptidase
MKRIGLCIAASLFLLHTEAQGPTKRDYARAVSFLWQNVNNKKAYNLYLQANWFADSSGFWYLTQDKEGKTYHKWLRDGHEPTPLFDQERLASILSDSLHTTVSANALPIADVKYVNKTTVEFSVKRKTYVLHTDTYTLSVTPVKIENDREERSPDGKWVAYSDHYNLYLKSTSTGEVRQMSKDGIKDYEYASYYGWDDIMVGENGARPPHFAVNWSPDSKWIQTYICDLRSANKMYLLDWSVDTLYRPRLLSYYRGSPGDTDMVHMTPVYFNVETGQEIRKDEFRNVNAVSCEWSKEPGISYIDERVRGYQHVNLYRYDVQHGNLDKIYTESSPTNIDNFRMELVEGLGKMLLISEKDGWRQLYLLTIGDHSVRPVTNGAWYVDDVLFIDKKKGRIIFTASGKEKGRNPYFQHAYTINLDGSGLRLLTPENANHNISVSPDGEYFVDDISALDLPTRSVLRDGMTGKIIKELSEADIEGLMDLHYQFPQAFTAIARDGSTTIYGAIWKPTGFDSLRKYPIIDQTYTGPHTHQFPEDFVSSLTRSNQALAELGFIVVTVDGMGTAGRSKAFHNVSYKNMGKNLLDHVLAIRQLGRRYSWIDTTRVGIFGHSAGGYDAGHAVLEFPDFYKVAVASSGDHDFRMEKDWWPEMYMGWPVDSTYNEVSNITMAGNLKGKLLIVHGGIDENVNPSATFKLAEALEKADKEFDMLILPSQHHGYQRPFSDYFLKKKWNYFVENLLGEKAIWDFPLR